MGSKTDSFSRGSDIELGLPPDNQFNSSFSNSSIRNAFIRKVYFILAIQFLLTTLIVFFMYGSDDRREFFFRNNWLMFLAMGVEFVTVLLLGCCPKIRRSVPINYILLGIFTIALSILAGYGCIQTDSGTILIACGLTFGICLAVSIFSYYTSFDLTKCYWIMFLIIIVFALGGLVLLFWPNRTASIIYACIGVTIFIIYLAMDTQAIMGGRSIEISPEDYIVAVIQLYMDIIFIFLYLLQIIGQARQ